MATQSVSGSGSAEGKYVAVEEPALVKSPDNLPDDLHRAVVSFLPLSDVASYAKVCKCASILVRTPELFEEFAKRSIPDYGELVALNVKVDWEGVFKLQATQRRLVRLEFEPRLESVIRKQLNQDLELILVVSLFVVCLLVTLFHPEGGGNLVGW